MLVNLTLDEVNILLMFLVNHQNKLEREIKINRDSLRTEESERVREVMNSVYFELKNTLDTLNQLIIKLKEGE